MAGPIAFLVAFTTLTGHVGAAEAPDAAGLRLFREKIQPVLESSCYECHAATATKIKGGLRLDSREASRHGGETGPAVVPGDPRKSLLIQAIRHEGDLQMPAKKPKLSDTVIADFVKWVELGAPDPRESETTPPPSYDFKKAREFWAFQPVKRREPPAVKDKRWVKTPLDQFVLAKLEAQNDEATRKLNELAGSINTLETQIVETRRKLDASEGDRIYLTKELSRLQSDKAELIRQFNDLAVLRAQVALLKEEAVVNQRMAWMAQGLLHTAGRKGAEGLMKKTTVEAARTPSLDVEIDQKTGTKVITPETK